MMELEYLSIKGARQHNLRIDEILIPKKKLVVFTGVSGSGKSSLAFDTIYDEGQRRYVESLYSYARQFLGQMEKPLYDHIRGLSPTIAIEQKSASSNPRSTVGTITEIHDFLRVLYARVGVQHCPNCDRVVEPLSIDQIVARIGALTGRIVLLAPLVDNRKGEFRDLFSQLMERGFARVQVDGTSYRLDEGIKIDKKKKHDISLIVDRLDLAKSTSSRLRDSSETALREGLGRIVVQTESGTLLRLSSLRACPDCAIGLSELAPPSFSFNSPLGMCQGCNGLGRKTEMEPSLVIPNETLSIRQGAIVPLASIMERGAGLSFGIFAALEKEMGIDLDCPWNKLPEQQRTMVLYGTGDKRVNVQWDGRHGSVRWAMTFEGVLNTLMRRYRETKSETMREYYQKYQAEADCGDCNGTRLCAESRAVRVGERSIVEVGAMSIGEVSRHFCELKLEGSSALVASELLKEIVGRLEFLKSVGLDYLSLDRPGPSLSGGEAQRIRLASQLGSELSGVIYVLDEPSIGLHQRDNAKLIQTLERLRDIGNSVIVVEHDADTIRAADYVIDFGPGAGEQGGAVTFQGPPQELLSSGSLTGQYLSGEVKIEVPTVRRRSKKFIRVLGATENNLKNIDVAFPLGSIIAVTGVSGAGKSSLISGILHPALCRQLHGSAQRVGSHRGIDGVDLIDKTIHIDQSPIGRTPRSNPATYTKCFDLIRDIFANTKESRACGYKSGRFSFNVPGGRCEACAGDGVKKVEMHFLPDVYVLCDVCKGRRYNEATLEVKYKNQSIADVLGLSVVQAMALFSAQPKLKLILQTLCDVGLDYVKLGQPATTLSGGEAQRVKLSRELSRKDTGRTLYVLDEPTTGLHFADIHKLLRVLDRLVEAGNTIVIIEHNLDVIKCADYVIDMGPEGGERGGYVVAEGSPEQIAENPNSVTGTFLRKVL